MFERFKYKRATRDYFNPELNIDVSQGDLLKILRGEIVNPTRLISTKRCKDYSFMIVGVPLDTPLNSWAGGQWGINNYSIAQESADWYAKICCEGVSQIAIPSRELVIDVDPHAKSDFDKIFSHKTSIEPYRLRGVMDMKGDLGKRTLVSDLSLSDLTNCIRRVFPR